RGGRGRAGRRTGRSCTASVFLAASGLTALVAAARRLACALATAIAAAVIQAKHAFQELETEALAAQAYADYQRTKHHVPSHRATSPLTLNCGCVPVSLGVDCNSALPADEN